MGYIEEIRTLIGHRPIILPGCCVFIRNAQGQILMQQRKHPYGKWGLPGGLMELGESTVDTIRREVKEETGLLLGDVILFGVYSGEGYRCTAENGEEFDVVITVYETSEYEGEVAVMDEESLTFEWFSIESLPENIAGTHSKIVRDYIAREEAGNSQESEEEHRARIYPIVLNEHNPEYSQWYTDEKVNIERLISAGNIAQINHYGSTAVPGLVAKPTVDILLELKEGVDLKYIASLFPESEYYCQWRDVADDPLVIYKGYTLTGFTERVYHIHVRYFGDWDELYFRDYLIAHPETADKYAELKQNLMQQFKHDRDGYTDAKGDFIRAITKIARKERAV